MTVTTEYGTWYNHTHSELTVETDVANYIGGGPTEWVERITTEGYFDSMVEEFRAQINAALPRSVSLCGNDFYGPYYADDTDFDDYPVDERGRLDVTEIIKGIDLAPIVERFDPDQDDATDDHGHMAAIGVTNDIVSGPWCDLTVAETDVRTYRVDDDGTETPELVMSPRVIDGPTDLPVYVDEDDKRALVENIADQALEEAGWERIGPWELTDSAFYAPVTRA